MKSAFFVCSILLPLGGIFAIPAIATEFNPTSMTQVQSQPFSSVKNKGLPKNIASFETQLLKLTNLERQRVGLAPLKLSSQLTRAAQSHSTDMARNSYFSHTGKNGSSMADRTKATGYKYSYLGENLAAGRSTPEGTLRQWMNSSGHRANILNRSFTEIGFGYTNEPNSPYRHYWVQVFGTPMR